MLPLKYLVLVMSLACASSIMTGCESCDSLLGLIREPTPDVENPGRYTAGPLFFSYPGNWTCEGETRDREGVTVTVAHVESAGSAYLGVQFFSPALTIGGDELFDEISRELPQQIDQISAGIVESELGEVTTFQRRFLGEDRSARRRTVGLNVIGEQVPHTIEGHSATLPNHTISVFAMINDEDAERARSGFDLVIDTLEIRALATPETPAQAQ